MNISRYQGIRKVEITTKKKTSNFDYDPGFEVYDMWSTRANSVDDNPIISVTQTTNAGFQLNNSDAKFITLSGYKETLNDRIAVSGSDWKAHYGLMSTKTSGWSYFSVCNLREGDRVVLYYTGEAPIFSSNGNGDYNGSAAFRDTWNDGVLNTDYTLDDEKDQIIKAGDAVTAMHSRPENNISRAEGRDNRSVWLYTSYAYTVMENGHLDFAIKNDGVSRIVKVKVYSDHQAMMVDDTDEQHFTYKSYFNITGELQAKEHIMPGGLEIHVGNTDSNATDQNAVVVASNEGPVSYVKAVDGYKIPGITKSGVININFNLHNVTAGQDVANSNIPKTGTFYKFMPEQDGEITVKFLARSMNYYRYDIPGDGIYYADNTSSGPWYAEWDRPNEQTRDFGCPYYLVTAYIDNGVEKVESIQKIDNDINAIKNGDIKEFTINNAQEGKIYYLYGGWRDVDTNNNNTVIEGITQSDWTQWGYNGHSDNVKSACGVAELLSVKFSPKNGVFPLSKWVKNGTEAVNKTNPAIDPDDLSTPEYELAKIKNFTTADITVKKMSGNITECHPYIVEENGERKLRIDGIKFIDGKNPGGTILMKLGDPARRSTPVFALTIAYSTDPKYDEQQGSGIRGHVWDYSTYSLNGLTWDTTNGKPTPTNEVFTSNDTKYAVVTDYGTSDTNGLLKTELGHGDWLENYNLIYNGVNYDKIFLNKYDVEGDNADVYWDTEGMVLKTSANQSGMNNEYGQTVSHSESNDPDRYIGILEGGEFRIPWLMKNDRVIIWMGTGKGRFADEVKLNIRNAYDALHKPIKKDDDSNSDEYIIGGSHWDGADGDKDYRGCYHFFATGNPNDETKPADMVFKMTEGSLCKIYKIQIYRGDRIITNEIVGETEADNKFFLWSRAYDPNDTSDKAIEGQEGYGEKGYTDTHNYNWALKYLGKDQQLANGTGKNSQENEIIAQTGKYSGTPALTNNLEVAEGETTSKVESFTYKHQLGEIGTFRMRGKDMEKNMNYVADYADHNVTIAYQQTQPYPYTWDFTDVTGIAANVTSLFDPEEKLGETIESTTKPDGLTDEEWETIWGSLDDTSYQKTSRDLSLWEVSSTNGGYMLRLNSQASQTLNNPMEKDNIFETAKEIGGNQVWANGTIVPEMQGLLFYTEYTDETNQTNQPNLDNYQENGEWTIKKGDANNVGGLEFDGPGDFLKIVVPNVPKDAAVYLRMTKSLPNGAVVKYKFGEDDLATISSNTDTRKFYQVPGTNYDYIVALLNTNSSKATLTLSLNGYRIQKLAVSEDPKTVNKKGYASESHKRVLDHSLTSFFTGKNIKAYLAKNYNESASTIELVEIKRPMPAATGNGDNVGSVLYNNDYYKDEDNVEHGQVDILDGGFHLFVPDMHDYTGNPNDIENMKTGELENTSGNLMLSYNAGETSNATIPQKIGGSVVYVLSYQYYDHDKDGQTLNEAQEEAFYRVNSKGATIKPNSAYITFSSTSQAKVSFLWEDELFGEINNGIATGISEATDQGTRKMEWYSLDGRKLNGAPTEKGLYIVNGKKVLVK